MPVSPLFDNAIDSLRVGMREFRDGATKHAILLVFHSVELFLKELLARQHPILIYKKIDQPITADSETVGLIETLGRLRNAGHDLDKEERSVLESLRRRRNTIEHHRYEPQPSDTDHLARALKLITSFLATHLGERIESHVDEPLLNDILALILSLDERRALAEHALEEWGRATFRSENGDDWFDDPAFIGTVECPDCNEEFLILHQPDTPRFCFFCRKQVDAAQCAGCAEVCKRSQLEDGLCSDCASKLG